MAMLNTDELIFPGIITLLSCYQLASFAQKVGGLRRKHKVNPPETNGPPEFIRGFRAQQNCLEFFPIYMGCLWVSAVYFHQVPVSVVGLVYMYARGKYMEEYIRSAEARVPPFKMSVNCLKAFLGMAGLGLTQAILAKYMGINLKEMVGLDKFIKF